jgi:hypothetical protein
VQAKRGRMSSSPSSNGRTRRPRHRLGQDDGRSGHAARPGEHAVRRASACSGAGSTIILDSAARAQAPSRAR